MIRSLVLAVLMLSASCVLASNHKAQQVRIAVEPLEGILMPDSPQLPYNQLLEVVFKRAQLPYRMQFMPQKRRLQLIRNDRVNCTFPDNLHQFDDAKRFIESEPINYVNAYLFTLTEHGPQTLDHMAGAVVLHKTGYTFDGLFKHHPNKEFVALDTTDRVITLLEAGRAQGYLDYIPDIFLSLSAADRARLVHDETQVVRYFIDRFMCLNTPLNQALLDGLNEVIVELRRSGQLAQLLGDFYQAEP